MMRVQIYTNDREQPIDLEVLEMRSQAKEITTNENGQQRGRALDQTVREVIRDPTIGASANLLFTTPDRWEGAIYLDTEKVAAIITSWASVPSTSPRRLCRVSLIEYDRPKNGRDGREEVRGEPQRTRREAAARVDP